MKSIKIDNSNELSKFEKHLSDQGNKRILVTAPFGAGKSYFLKEFFNSQQEYLSVTLFPGDYSVSSNEDIFELIKYDIIDALITDYPEKLNLTSNDFSTLLLAQQFLAKKVDLIPLFKSIAQSQSLGIDQLLEIFESTKTLYEKFSNFKDEMNADEIKRLKNFMEPFESKRGSIRENDAITQFISELLQRIKAELIDDEDAIVSIPKKTVLVIDDLDRLEADQIFRLFNIFSAHYDSREDANKFCFDKVILVCDLDNLEYMFRHRYGLKANFDGYIDKFYSYSPFIFNLQSFLKQKSSEFLLYIDANRSDQKLFNAVVNDNRYGKKSTFFDTVSNLAEVMIDQSLIRARNFQKFKGYELANWEITMERGTYSSKYFPFLIMSSMLAQLFPRITDLVKAIDEIAMAYPSNYEIKQTSGYKNYQGQLISYALPFLVNDFVEIVHSRSGADDHVIQSVNEYGEKVFIVFKVKEYFQYDFVDLVYSKTVKNGELVNKQCMEQGVSNPNYYHFLSMALKNCIRNGYL